MARTRHTIGPRLEIPRNGAWAGPQLSDLFCQWNEQAVEGRESSQRAIFCSAAVLQCCSVAVLLLLVHPYLT